MCSGYPFSHGISSESINFLFRGVSDIRNMATSSSLVL
uniref:Uncharacterized protein n=1 Tax=Arundo donax TaxID=35708 RepID=A0A0A9BK79_ARUDO